jgi:hypothetical protein
MSQSATDSPRNNLRYMGQDYRFAPTFLRKRDPIPPYDTSPDIKPPENQGYYPVTSLWTNTTNNNVWVLRGIKNNLADWFLLASGVGDAGILTIEGNGGGPQPPDVAGNFKLLTENTTVEFLAGVNEQNLDFGLTNLIIGSKPELDTGAGLNVGLGIECLSLLTTGSGNTCAGAGAGSQLLSGNNNTLQGAEAGKLMKVASFNTAVGVRSLYQFDPALQVGEGNTALGYESLRLLVDGVQNTGIGYGAGSNYTSNESSNLVIDNDGVVGDLGAIRIGDPLFHTTNFQAGITGVTVPASAPVGVDANGQLSSLDFGLAGQVYKSNGPGVSGEWGSVGGAFAGSTVEAPDAINLVTATNENVTTLALGIGTWVVSAIVQFGGNPTVSGMRRASISSTSLTHSVLGNNSVQDSYAPTGVTFSAYLSIPSYIVTLGAPLTLYLVASGEFSAGAMTAYGRISANQIA